MNSRPSDRFGAVCARRRLESTHGPVEVIMRVPVPDGDDYRCDYVIEGPRTHITSHALGIDGFQALEMALQKIGTDLLFSEEGQTGALRWLDDPGDVGFPLPDSVADLDPRRRG
jgi:hypothetical protein